MKVYGDAHADEFAGVYFDRQNGGQLVARFTRNVEVHQRALDALLGSQGLVVVQGAAFTEASLQAIVETIGTQYHELAVQGIILVRLPRRHPQRRHD